MNRLAPLLVLIGSAAVVGTALLTQYVGDLAPCELCLYERWPYYAAIALALLGLVAGASRAILLAAILLTALLFLAGAALSFYHVGVERHVFAGPTACTGTQSAPHSIEDLRAQLLAQQPVRCDVPQWSFHGITLARLDFIASLALAGVSLWGFARIRSNK